MIKSKRNFLEYIPVKNRENTWTEERDGFITIRTIHKGFFAFIAQRCFARPPMSHIHLDKYGSFLWQAIDGRKTIGQLALLIKNEYGEKAEPLYNRLVHYMKILHNNNLILWQKKE